MNKKCVAVLLLFIGIGCRNDADVNSGDSNRMATREQMTEIALEAVREIGHFQEGDNIKIYFDIDNKKWHDELAQLDEDLPEDARFYHERLDNRSYQAIFFAHDPPSVGGTYWVFVDTKTKKVIGCAAGF